MNKIHIIDRIYVGTRQRISKEDTIFGTIYLKTISLCSENSLKPTPMLSVYRVTPAWQNILYRTKEGRGIAQMLGTKL